MIWRNIAVRAGSLIGSPRRTATVRAVLLSWPAVMMPSGSGTIAAVVEEHVDVVLRRQQRTDVAVEDEVRLDGALDRLLDLGVGTVDEVPDPAADLPLPVGQRVDVLVDPRVPGVGHGRRVRAARVVHVLERPRVGQPRPDHAVEDRVQGRDVRSHPRPTARLETGVLRRIDVDAADDDLGIGLEHRVGEPAPGGEVVRVPNQVAEVLGRRHRVRPGRALQPGVRRMWSMPAVQAA